VKKILDFVKEAHEEFRKIEWPDKAQTMRLTGFVIGVSFGIGVFVLGVDYLFKEALNQIIK